MTAHPGHHRLIVPNDKLRPYGKIRIDEFQQLDHVGGLVGLAFESKRGGTQYRFIVCNDDGKITKLERHIGNGEWEHVDEEPPFGLKVLVRHRLNDFA